MNQSRISSLLETSLSTLTGYFVAVITQITIFPHYDINISVADNLKIALIFTVVSILRGYAFRRLFNRLSQRGFG